MKILTPLMLKIPKRLFLCLSIANLITACGGSGSSGAFDSINTTGTMQDTTSSPLISTELGTVDLFAGNYSLAATPASNPTLSFLDCSVTPGEITIYNGNVIGYIDGNLIVMGSINDSGQITATASSGTTLVSEINGIVNNNGGSGRYGTSSLCQGNWTATRIIYTAPELDQQFTLPTRNYPAALRMKFVPAPGTTTNAVECTNASGLIETNGRISLYDNEIDYNGYAETSAGYRWDVDLRIDTDSGEIEGEYRYDPLAISGSFEGDAYFGGTPRLYESSRTSHDEGCHGSWQMTVVDIPFPEPAEVLSDTVNQNIESNNNETDNTGTIIGESQIPNYSNEVPSCEVARLRILSSVEPGMSPTEVVRLVGIPLDIKGLYGSDWDYSTNSFAEIEFQYSSSQKQPSIVQGYNAEDAECSENIAIAQLRAVANDLALQPSSIDFSNEIPTCFDAATRTLARVRIGMTPADVRRLVGKPNSIDGIYGTDWNYGDHVEIEFSYDSTPQPTLVNGYRTSTSVTCR